MISHRLTPLERPIPIFIIGVFVLWISAPLLAQSTTATGSIQGTLTDPSGAVVTGVKVIITNTDTGQVLHVTTSSAGTYNSGALVPGNYSVRAEAAGFKTVEEGVVVKVGVVSGINLSLQVGAASTVVTVAEQSVSVNTEQPSVQGVLNRDQIENLPVNGRNFLDLAQLEPGVQIQDGGDFDPTKVGFSSISVGGRFGRTARIEVDGVDVSDETVGTTTENIPASAIDEFQISQSTLDLSNELTSSGAVNVTTRSGTNSYHGEASHYFATAFSPHRSLARPHPINEIRTAAISEARFSRTRSSSSWTPNIPTKTCWRRSSPLRHSTFTRETPARLSAKPTTTRASISICSKMSACFTASVILTAAQLPPAEPSATSPTRTRTTPALT
jgi:hypothetical protein